MRKIITIVCLGASLLTSVVASATDCLTISKEMNPYKGMTAKITDVKVEKYKSSSLSGWKYSWKYQFPGRPTHSTWSVLEDGKKPTHLVKNGDLFFFTETQSPALKKMYQEKNTKGYVPVLLLGAKCEKQQTDSSAEEAQIAW